MMDYRLKLAVLSAVICSTLLFAKSNPLNEKYRLVEAHLDLRPWFDQLKKRILLKSIEVPSTKRMGDINPILTFELSKDNKIKNLKVLTSSGSDSLDLALLNVVRNSAAFPAPPNDLPFSRGLYISFKTADFAPKSSDTDGITGCFIDLYHWGSYNPDVHHHRWN